ncbi:MAG: hypothetical protein ABI591_26210 [Kofleriaceae bacterium]
MRLALAFGAISILVAGCHKADDPGADIDGSIGSGGGSDAAVAGFTMLISRSWTVPSNTEAYKCVRVQIPNDTWISAFRSLSPVGTHHSVLTISTNNAALGEYDCNASSSLLDPQMLYAAGINTDDNDLPDGVAIHVAAGTVLNLNLHLFNTTDNPITDTSGVLVKTMAAADVTNEADMQFSGRMYMGGTQPFQIPANATGDSTTVTPIKGGCQVAHDFHLFTLWPHMHQIAVHQTFSITGATWGAGGGQGTTTLLDTDYTFTDQKNYPMIDTVIHAGDQINTTCDYINTTGSMVTFGESSNNEMCFTGMYRYPAANNLLACALGQSI